MVAQNHPHVREVVGYRHPMTPDRGGYLVPITTNFPITDVQAIARSIPVLCDTDGDDVADVQVLARVTPQDTNGNGVLDMDGSDHLFIRPVHAEAIQADAALEVGAAERQYVAERIVGMLSREGESFQRADARA
jgi:hypothetical protein